MKGLKNITLANRVYMLYAESNDYQECLRIIVGYEEADILSQAITERCQEMTAKELRLLINELKKVNKGETNVS